MIDRLKPKSEFSRNVLKLMTGTAIAQAIPIAITPILTRLYTPEDFGLLALFISICGILSSIVSGRYEYAIMLPKSDRDAINIAAIAVLITCFSSFLLFFIVFIFNEEFTRLLNNREIGIWLYFVPLTVFMVGMFNIFKYLNIRKKFYKDVAIANVYKSIAMVVFQLAIGLAKAGASGLIVGQIVSHFFANYRLARNTLQEFDLRKISKLRMLSLLGKHINFPKYSMPAILLNALSYNIINIVISLIYSLGTLGFYSIAQRVLGVPISLVGNAVGQVFFQEAARERHETGVATHTFDKTVIKLILIAVPIFWIIFLIAEDLFAVVFGDEWRVAGHYVTILIPMFAVRFIVTSVIDIDAVTGRQNYFLIFNILLLLVVVLIMFAYQNSNIDEFLSAVSYSVSIVYFVYGFVLRSLARQSIKKTID